MGRGRAATRGRDGRAWRTTVETVGNGFCSGEDGRGARGAAVATRVRGNDGRRRRREPAGLEGRGMRDDRQGRERFELGDEAALGARRRVVPMPVIGVLAGGHENGRAMNGSDLRTHAGLVRRVKRRRGDLHRHGQQAQGGLQTSSDELSDRREHRRAGRKAAEASPVKPAALRAAARQAAARAARYLVQVPSWRELGR
jgi:hypothetical protein